ncbi:RsmB/NOP family class I SAM-dependent RNA methyltransferase [Sulfolobus acidocaldarius]|uniref:RsmB/NOP family class I SAM-dependent RNA methyltransferase n=1 Tax=Sulfolobus acidocaldarius TaxID=2285 RepID=UPI000781F19F|nr:RsmB/NOP family class I SAM-dependent RNA methyltransferase [Sulfolobus acidocaldarius]
MNIHLKEYIKKYDKLFSLSPSYQAVRLSNKYGFLDYMVERYIHMFDSLEDAESFMRSCTVPLEESIRCNDLVTTCSTMEYRLEEKNFELEKVQWLPHGYRVIKKPNKPSLGATVEYLNGYYYIQGLASMVPAYVLNPHEEDTVLDMAAAPGGKTTQLAQLMKNKGLIIATEKSRRRARSLISNINRMHARNIILIRSDASTLSKTRIKFSKILLDAPCSGEGIIFKDTERRKKTSLSDLKNFSLTQMGLLTIGYDLLDKNGILVYSTCSIAPEEDELVVNYGIEELGFRAIKISGYPADKGISEFTGVKFSHDVNNCIRFYPHEHGTEGFFVCALQKD